MNNKSNKPVSLNFNGDKHALVLLVIVIGIPLALTSCDRKLKGAATLENGNTGGSGASSTAIDAVPIIERYRALDTNRDGTMTIRASIHGANEGSLDEQRQIQFNMYRKLQPDGRQLILIEFTAEERDRSGLITVFPDGQVEGVRYIQSTDSYIATRDLRGEDALFGLTLQELADGQPEKYDFTITGEQTVEGQDCYRADGKLKQGVESKFQRVMLLISKETFASVQAKFYDNRDELVRDMVVSKTEPIAGRWTRVRWTIDNPARRKKVDFEAIQVKYDERLGDLIFTREHLKKISSR